MQLTRIACPVPSFLVMTDEGDGILQKGNAPHDLCANIRVMAHYHPFFFTQGSRLVQDRVADADLADVV